jgi:hypothetical protein
VNKSFIKGVFTGLLVPLMFLGAAIYWVHKLTSKVPFPIDRPAEGQLTWGLVPVEEVPEHWERWEPVVAPLRSRIYASIAQTRATVFGLIAGNPPA